MSSLQSYEDTMSSFSTLLQNSRKIFIFKKNKNKIYNIFYSLIQSCI